MRESPLPDFAGEAGLVDGRVVVAIAKCMALCGLRPVQARESRSAAAFRIGEFEKVAHGRQREPAHRAEGTDNNEERNSARQRRPPSVSRNHEGEAEAEAIEGSRVHALSLRAPRTETKSDDAPRDEAIRSEREVVLPADPDDYAQNSSDDNLFHELDGDLQHEMRAASQRISRTYPAKKKLVGS